MGKPIPPEALHRLLREVLRNYLTFEALVSQMGVYEIEYKGVELSFLDLQGALATLSKRKREAVHLNVILDKKQKDVAEIMGITTVSVGQYVEQAMIQLAKHHFAERLTEVVGLDDTPLETTWPGTDVSGISPTGSSSTKLLLTVVATPKVS